MTSGGTEQQDAQNTDFSREINAKASNLSRRTGQIPKLQDAQPGAQKASLTCRAKPCETKKVNTAKKAAYAAWLYDASLERRISDSFA